MAINGRDFSLAIFAALIWGGTFPLSAIALTDTPPLFFNALRFTLSAAFIVVVPRPDIPWRTLIALGLLLGASLFGLMFLSMTKGISASLASLLIHSQAFFTILIAMAIYGERLTQRQVIGIALAIAGFILLAIDRFQSSALIGFVLIMLAALCGGIGNNMLKSLGKADMLGVIVWMSLAVPLPMLVLSLIFEADGSITALIGTITWPVVAAALYLSILATVLVYTIWAKLLVRYQAAIVAPFFLLVPVFGISLSVWILGETLSSPQLAGSGLIFAGLTLTLWPKNGAT